MISSSGLNHLFAGPSMVTPVKKVPIHLQSAQNRVIIRSVCNNTRKNMLIISFHDAARQFTQLFVSQSHSFPQKRNSGQWWWRRASRRLHWGKQLILVDFGLFLTLHIKPKMYCVVDWLVSFPNPLAFEGASGLEKLPSYREGFGLILRSQVLTLALALIH